MYDYIIEKYPSGKRNMLILSSDEDPIKFHDGAFPLNGTWEHGPIRGAWVCQWDYAHNQLVLTLTRTIRQTASMGGGYYSHGELIPWSGGTPDDIQFDFVEQCGLIYLPLHPEHVPRDFG